MSEKSIGRVVKTKSNGDLTIIPPRGKTVEVGERFHVLNESKEPIAEIKVVSTDSSETIARYFQPFVSDETLRAATKSTGKAATAKGAAAGATAGAIAASVVPLFGTVVGAATGAVIGSVLARRSPRQPIRNGMTIVPIADSSKNDQGDGLTDLASPDG